MKILSAAWKKIHRLHLGLYFLFTMSVAFGSTTSLFFEKYSIVDTGLLKTQWEHFTAAQAKIGRAHV